MKLTYDTHCFFSLISHFVLLLLVISFFTVQRLSGFEIFFVFDLLLLVYIVVSMVFCLLRYKSFKVLRFTAIFVLFLNVVLFPASILLLFSNDIQASIKFVNQYYFTFYVLPLFINYLFVNQQFVFFMSTIFYGFLLVGASYVYVFINPSMVWDDFFVIESSKEHYFGYRFFLGEFTPNEMGHYLVLFILSGMCLPFSRGRGILKNISSMLVFFTFICTLSKTVWVQILSYLFLIKTAKIRLVFIFGFSLSIVIIYVAIPISVENIISDFSIKTASNSKRVEMFTDSIEYLPFSILSPAFHAESNLVRDDLKVTSAHNGLLSFANNFGLVSFSILLVGASVFFVAKVTKKNIVFLYLMIIDLIVLIFNPLINARQVWLPFFILVFVFYLYPKYFNTNKNRFAAD